MKLLLTSGGVTNPALHRALEDLLAKPVAEASALCVPTARWGHTGGPVAAEGYLDGRAWGGTTSLGWGSLSVLELTALPTVGEEAWVPWVRAADAIVVAGGEATYLAHWLRSSGLADLLPSLTDTVWVGVSAGSMALTPRIGREFVGWEAAPDDGGLGVVGFSLFPHLGGFPENQVTDAERWAAGLGGPAYALDDASAVVVVDGEAQVVSEGTWRYFPQQRSS